ncbi:MAG: AAA family ATPase [Phycisphaerales bacterium]|nr:AAA family ATPase [Phycisphaerales bacterium]
MTRRDPDLPLAARPRPIILHGATPPSRTLHWLWPLRLPVGALSLLIGDPGAGKSLLTADLAARLSAPYPWPDDPPDERPDPATLPPLPPQPSDADLERSFPTIRGVHTRSLPILDTLFASPEDADALPARLAAAGAHRAHVATLAGVSPPRSDELLPLRLPTHADQLEQAIRAYNHTRLVVLDPLHLLLDDGVHASPDLQAHLLARLAAIARRYDLAILAVGHFTKRSARRAIYRIRGALSLIAAARSILLLTADPDQPNRRILTQLKSAYAHHAPPLAFRIVTATPLPLAPVPPPPGELTFRTSPLDAPGPEAPVPCPAPAPPLAHYPCPHMGPSPTGPGPRLLWDLPDAGDWRLSTGLLDLSSESHAALSEACHWLTAFLAGQPVPARALLTAAQEAGVSRFNLLRAKRLLNVASQRRGHAWFWIPTVPR